MSARVPTLILLAFVFLIQFITMPANLYRGDAIAIREETRAIINQGSLNVPAGIAVNFGEPGQYLTLNPGNGLYYSKYGLMNALLYLPPLLLEKTLYGELPGFSSVHAVLLLNLWNIALAMALALVLFRITGLYSSHMAARAGFVGLCFYATFLWNYLRAQTVEIFHVLLFAQLLWHWLRLARSRDLGSRDFYAAWFLAGALTLAKVSFVLLLPWLGLTSLFLLRQQGAHWRQAWLRSLRACGPVIAGIALVVGGVHWVKFGAPWLTGYHQWRPEIHSLTGDYRDSLQGLLFSLHWSVWTNFPVLALALFGWRGFWARHRFEAIGMLAVAGVFYLAIGKLPSWRGEVCYGPRYFLFLFPMLSLPALTSIEALWEGARARWDRRALAGAALAILAYSAVLQERFNRYEFHTFDDLRIPLALGMPLSMALYVEGTHYGRLNWDLASAHGDYGRFDWFRDLGRTNPPQAVQGYRDFLNGIYARMNYYWFR